MAAVFTNKKAGAAPGFMLLQTVERMAGGDTGFATGAGIQIDLEGILLAGSGSRRREQRGIAGSGTGCGAVVPGGKPLHRRELPLFLQQLVQHGAQRRIAAMPVKFRE
jgi:hypothetical protein